MANKNTVAVTLERSKKARKGGDPNAELIGRLDELIRAMEANTRRVSLLEQRLSSLGPTSMASLGAVLKGTAAALPGETLTNQAEWLLRELDPKSNVPAQQIVPEDNLKNDLGLTELNIRALAGSMDFYVKQGNPGGSISKPDVEKAKTVRGELKLIQKEITDQEPSDAQADEAIEAARRHV